MIRRGLHRITSAAGLRPVWRGVYNEYRDVPVRGPGFNGAFWVAATRRRTLQAHRELGARQTERTPLAGERALLPLLAASVVAQHGHVSVLDFGGGMGIGYIDIRRAVLPPANVRYVVVETDEVSTEGRAIFGNDKNVGFVARVQDAGRDFDIVHVNSALQYIEDYRGLLRELARVGAEFMLFVNMSAGEVPTYATAQLNVPGSVLAYWFLNLGEVVALLREEGYALVLDMTSGRKLRGFAVPRQYRVDHGRDLLFARAKG